MSAVKKRLTFAITLVILCVFNLKAQNKTSNATTDGSPTNCEINQARLDEVSISASDQNRPDDVLIIIARLGDGEKSDELSRHRLYNAREYILLKQPALKDKIITAVADKTNGYGRVEFYYDGKLIDRLLVPKNKSLCVDCCEDYAIKPYKSQRKVKRKARRRKTS